MQLKTVPARLKAVPEGGDTPAGVFEGYASVFGNTDSVGDVVQKGAFTDTLAKWQESGSPMPVIWSHRHDDPMAHIGVVTDAKEDDHGLFVKAQLDIADNPTAAQVYRLIKGGRVKNMSFAYDIVDAEENSSGGYDLKALDVFEVGPTLIGANQATDITDVKSAKAGRALSAKNETSLRNAVELLQGVLDSLGPNEDGKATVAGPVKDEEPQAKSDVPAQRTPATVRLTIETRLAELGI
jgi:HK97 family phage prohead protease